MSLRVLAHILDIYRTPNRLRMRHDGNGTAHFLDTLDTRDVATVLTGAEWHVRFDFKDRSIAFSGDTALKAVAKMAEGADVLVHEAMYVPAVEAFIRGQIAKGRPFKF
jgi:ribonuclease BN (tRNA processing enzyme)